MSVNKISKTQYDSDEDKYIQAIKDAGSEEELNSAKAELNKITKSKWSTADQYTMSTEIEARYNAGDSGIYKDSYKKYKDAIDNGTELELLELSRSILASADTIVYSEIARDRKKTLDKEIRQAEQQKKEDEAKKINNPKESPNGTYTLKDNDHPTATKEEVDLSKLDYDITMQDRRAAWVETNTEYHRTKTKDGFAVDSAILKRYYSSMDAEVYFGNEYVEDIYEIDWEIEQKNAPLFGYNSYTYDEVARGSRLIHGNFSINFTSPNYLFSILKAANKANTTMITNMASYNVPMLSADKNPEFRTSTYGTRERGHHNAMWPETFDIDIIFGEKSGAGDPVHVIILGVVITNCTVGLSAGPNELNPQPSGESNIYEIYQFVAQDIRTQVLNNSGDPASYEEGYKESYDGLDTTGINVGNANNPIPTEENTEEENAKAKEAKEKRDEVEKINEQHDSVKSYLEINNGTQDISYGSNMARKGAQRTIKQIEDGKYTVTFSYPNCENKETVKKLAEEDMDLVMAFKDDKEKYNNYNYSSPEINENDKTYTITISKK